MTAEVAGDGTGPALFYPDIYRRDGR